MLLITIRDETTCVHGGCSLTKHKDSIGWIYNVLEETIQKKTKAGGQSTITECLIH
jgi:hypothetical protein